MMMMYARNTRIALFFIVFFIQNVAVVLAAVADADTISSNDGDSTTRLPASADGEAIQHHHQQQLNQVIQEVLQSSEQTLQDYNEYTASAPIATTNPSLTEQINHLQNLFDKLEELETTRDQLVHSINTEQMKELQQRLANMIGSGVDPPAATDLPIKTTAAASTMATAVTIPEMERLLTPENVLAESEMMLSEWIRSIIRDEINQLDVQPFLSSSSRQFKQQRSTISSSSSSSCVPIETAAEEVYYGLMRHLHDGIGLVDFTHSIVHQYTSPTYEVMTDDDLSSTLSTVWWNRYIPQDWEYLLPHGWQSWKAWTFKIPDHIYHSMGGWWGRRSSQATCAPPEAILQSSTFPGHCWPVAMTSKPVGVTIRLHTSIIVSAISIDHTSKFMLSQRQQLLSAPKRIKAYGYAPCSSSSFSSSSSNSSKTICHGLGFDIMSKTLIAEFTYNIDDENNVQTFPVVRTDDVVDVSRTDSVESSCSATAIAGSCSGRTPVGATVAVTLEIVDNWGNTDYTCLYRVRVHGEPII